MKLSLILLQPRAVMLVLLTNALTSSAIPAFSDILNPVTLPTPVPPTPVPPTPVPPTPVPPATDGIFLSEIGRYKHLFDENGSEISAYDPQTKLLFVTNSNGYRLDILNLSDPKNPSLLDKLELNATYPGGGVNSVAIHAQSRLMAVALEAPTKQDNGVVALFQLRSTAGLPTFLQNIPVGALPDMVTFTPDGTYVVVANEGEPNNDYLVDPVGSISIISVSDLSSISTSTAGFESFNASPPPDVRIFGPGASVAQDLEPEYIAISADSTTAYVTLQENNALAVVDIASANVTNIYALGFKDHSMSGNELDASDRDDPSINIQNWPVFGMYQPDAIASYEVGGTTYLVTANEGDAREYDALKEEDRVKDLTLNSAVFTDSTIQNDDRLGRLVVTNTLGDTDDNGDFEELYAFGARSFSIWNGSTGALVFDSGSQIADETAKFGLPLFNNDDGRSDNKGAEPEGVVVGTVQGRVFAFIGLERTGGIMVYDVTVPTAPTFVQYVTPSAVDISPEGLVFISAEDSPIPGTALLVVNHEVSSTTAIFSIAVN